MPSPIYQRVLLKLSGEALVGNKKYGILRRDLISENGYTLDLEGRILDSLWSEE